MSEASVQNRGRDRLERQEGAIRTVGGDLLVLCQIRFLTDDDRREMRDILYGISYGTSLTSNASYAKRGGRGGIIVRTDLEVQELFVDDLDHVKALTRGD